MTAGDHRAFIGIGSNAGCREHNCRRAIDALAGWPRGRVVRTSSLYETEPWGNARQRRFVNCVIQMETGATAGELLQLMQATEQGMGKQVSARWGPRCIDLDLLLFNAEIIQAPGLQVPHPRMHQRRFVLEPLCEIAPDALHPLLRCRADVLLRRLTGAARAGQRITSVL